MLLFQQPHPATPGPQFSLLGTLARKLEAEEKVPIEISPELRDLVCGYVRKNEPISEFLGSIALAAHATLTQTGGGGYTIARSEADKASIKRFDRKITSDQLASISAKWAISDPKTPAFDLATSEAAAFNNYLKEKKDVPKDPLNAPKFDPAPPLIRGLPASRLLRKLIDRISVEKLADLDPDSTTFYSNQPIADELPVPDSADLMQQYAAERESFRLGAVGKIDPEQWKKERLPSTNWAQITPAATDIKFVLQVHREGYSLFFRISCFGPDGSLLDLSALSSMKNGLRMAYRMEASPFFFNPQAEWRALSQASADFCSRALDSTVKGPYQVVGGSNLSFRQSLKRLPLPDAFEPCGAVLPEIFSALPEFDSSKSFVCVVPDEACSIALDCVNEGRVNLTAFEALAMKGNLHEPLIEEVKSGDDLIVRPVDPLLNEAAQANRAELSLAIDHFGKQGWIDIRTWSRLNHDLGSAAKSKVASQYLAPAATAEPWILNDNPLPFSKFLGGLTGDQWDTLLSGSSISVDSANLALDLHDSTVDRDWGMVSNRSLPAVQIQPQEFYQETVSPAVPVRLRHTTEVVARYWIDQGKEDELAPAASAAEIGQRLRQLIQTLERVRQHTHQTTETEDQLFSEVIGNIPFKFRLARRWNYNFFIGDPAQPHLEKSLFEQEEPTGETLSFAELPPDFIQEIHRAAMQPESGTHPSLTPTAPTKGDTPR